MSKSPLKNASSDVIGYEIYPIYQKDFVPVNADFKDIVICALRYALGRRTYVVQEICEFISNNLDKVVDVRTAGIILDDLLRFLSNKEGDDMQDQVDLNSWQSLYIQVKQYCDENKIGYAQ